MQVFISWSGPLSQKIGEVFYFGTKSRSEEVPGLVEIIEGLPFTCDSVDDDILF